jgi:HPP family
MDILWATLGEGGLLLAPALLGWGVHQPLIFASLGPTAYELVEQPQIRSAKTYNVIVGDLIGLGEGFLALSVLNAWSGPNVLATGNVSSVRLGAAIIAVILTTFFTLVLKAGQSAALATTLLVSLGSVQTKQDALAIIAGVLLIAALGEPIRRFRVKHTSLRPVLEKLGRGKHH